MTNVPAPYMGPSGFVIPSDAEILAGVQADFQDAFGGNMNPALNTPQGQLASSMAAVISAAYATFLYYTTQVDPSYADGRMQDAVGAIYFLQRLSAQSTLVDCVCSGGQITIPAGTLARDASGNIYASVAAATIPIGGSITVSFANIVTGPIPCTANSLTQIYQAIPGWDSINNPTEGVLGSDTETRAQFELRRIASVAGNSVGLLQSLQGAVLAVAGVLDAFCYANPTSAPVTYRGVTLAPYSQYIAVVGGTDAAVAQAIWTKKSPGCAYNGNTSVVVYDTSPGYSPPYPAYTVLFQRPTAVPIKFAVSLTNNAQVPSDVTTQIQNALIAAFAGDDGGPRATIGSTIYASRFYNAVALLGPWAEILSIQIGKITANANTVVMNINEAPTISATDIAVTLV